MRSPPHFGPAKKLFQRAVSPFKMKVERLCSVRGGVCDVVRSDANKKIPVTKDTRERDDTYCSKCKTYSVQKLSDL